VVSISIIVVGARVVCGVAGSGLDFTCELI
jgi:hypothetical protein